MAWKRKDSKRCDHSEPWMLYRCEEDTSTRNSLKHRAQREGNILKMAICFRRILDSKEVHWRDERVVGVLFSRVKREEKVSIRARTWVRNDM